MTSRRLNSWKEVATYFQRDESTVKRWEAGRGLPIHRVPGHARSKIYAFTQELDAWFDASPDAPSAPEPAPGGALRAPVGARAAVFAALVAIGVIAAAWLLGTPRIRTAQIHQPRLLVTRDAQAIELYREGWHDWNTRTPTGLTRAREEFQQALGRDPRFAQAHAGLANTYLLLREYSNMPDAVAYPQAEASARRALALDPDLADAHSALGFIDYWWRWDPRAAEAELKRAIALSPASPDPHLWLANILKVQRRYDEALDQIDQAQTLDPDSSAVLEARGAILLARGDLAGGRKILAHLEEVEPNEMWPHADLARTALAERQYATYVAEAGKVAALKDDPDQKALLAAAQQGWRSAGPQGLLEALLRQQQRLAAAGRLSAYNVACTYMLMNQPDDATAWLRRATMAHDATVLGTFADPCFDALSRGDRLQFLRTIVFGA